MKPLPRRVRWHVLLRSLSVQGSWNYETLIGIGFAFTLLPALRVFYGTDPTALRAAAMRHTEVFNSHPYLVTVAAGAVLRLEAEGADPRMIERFKSALRGSLGSLGDRLIWSAWRPASVLLGLVLLLAGSAWWVGAAVFLLVHNALHLGLRVWGLGIGTRTGLEVGRVLREAPLQVVAQRAAEAGALLSGLAVALALAPPHGDWLQVAGAALGAAFGLWLGLRSRRIFGGVVILAWALAIFSGLFA